LDTAFNKSINIVWIKRDIRSQDHVALAAAEEHALPYLICYFYEPSLLAYPDTSKRHLRFIYQSILDLNDKLKQYNQSVHIFHGDAIAIFENLSQQFKIENIYSYQESGTAITWRRDIAVQKFCNQRNITWTEFQKDGVQRGITNRKKWDKHWYATMNKPILHNEYAKQEDLHFQHNFPLATTLLTDITAVHSRFQPGGETFAWRYLNSFTEERGKSYHFQISKPTESRKSCSRISPYLAWGNLSIKQALHHVNGSPNYETNKRAFSGMMTRLKWHDHFIQKFEVECRYENYCVNQGYETLEHPINEDFIEAWKTGSTGYPLVDACMRCLHATGWINFRMRAMVLSFLCHHLDQDWRHGTYHLARLFLDYVPGIHYPQFQMQAGTTGTNIVRIYNPIKQSQEHDPQGVYIRKWIPELTSVPSALIHEPWKMTVIEQGIYKVQIGKDYPAPLIDLKIAGKAARDKIWGHRKNIKVKQEKQRILATHVRPNRNKINIERKELD